MESLERAYSVHNQRYYGKAKRHNLLSNQYEVYKNIDPYDLSPGELKETALTSLPFFKDITLTLEFSKRL